MGEISRNLIAVLAILVILVSAIGTWTVMQASLNVLSGTEVSTSSPFTQTEDSLEAHVGVMVSQGAPPETGAITGKVGVCVGTC
jgi:hypothetical protein